MHDVVSSWVGLRTSDFLSRALSAIVPSFVMTQSKWVGFALSQEKTMVASKAKLKACNKDQANMDRSTQTLSPGICYQELHVINFLPYGIPWFWPPGVFAKRILKREDPCAKNLWASLLMTTLMFDKHPPCKTQSTSNRVRGLYFILRTAPDLRLGNQAEGSPPQPRMVTKVPGDKADGSYMVNDTTGVFGIRKSWGFTC